MYQRIEDISEGAQGMLSRGFADRYPDKELTDQRLVDYANQVDLESRQRREATHELVAKASARAVGQGTTPAETGGPARRRQPKPKRHPSDATPAQFSVVLEQARPAAEPEPEPDASSSELYDPATVTGPWCKMGIAQARHYYQQSRNLTGAVYMVIAARCRLDGSGISEATRDQVARDLGASASAVSNSFTRLRRQGVIETENHRPVVVIRDSHE